VGQSKPRKVDPRTPGEIEDWFVSYLAEALQTAPENIDVAAPFETFGLDSPTAIGMTGHLEDWLGLTIDPTVVYDYPTIEALAKHLAELTKPARP